MHSFSKGRYDLFIDFSVAANQFPDNEGNDIRILFYLMRYQRT
jgi:hypothetical protein